METTISKSIDVPFAMTASHARSLYELFPQSADTPAVELKVNCKDSASRTFRSLEELEEFDNTDNRRILSLSMTSILSQENVPRIAIHFHSEDRNSPMYDRGYVLAYVCGRDEDVVYLYSEINSKLEAMRPWYFKYTRIQGIHVHGFLAILVFIATYFIVSYAFFENSMIYKRGSATVDLMDSTFFVLFGPLITGIVAWLILLPLINLISKFAGKFRQNYFPSGAFLIGYQSSIETARDKLRHSIVNWMWRTVVTAPFLLLGYAFRDDLTQLVLS